MAGDNQKSLFDDAAPTRVQQRLIESSVDILANPVDEIAYQHTILCQTGMPYRSQGDLRRWQRRNGRALLEIEAGRAIHPEKDDFVDLPLPFGPKARLILIHLNSEAVRTGSPVIEVEDSMTAFMRRLQSRTPTGPEIKKFKEQLSALSASQIRLAVSDGERAIQVNTQVVSAFELWFPKDANQRVLWPSKIELSAQYYESLKQGAVPLDERAVAALAHSAMALDVYSWLAQRLHRVNPHKPQFIPWTAMHEQFGHGYKQIRQFRAAFLKVLDTVHTQYRAAKVGADRRGVTLRNSPPPVPGRYSLIK